MRRTLSWPILVPVLFGVCVAPNAWGWAELFDRFNNARPGTRMVDLHQLISSEAQRHHLPAHYVAAILQVESAAQPCALSHANAVGLMQIMPAVARRHGISDRYLPATNVRVGAAYLAEAMQLAGGDVQLASAIYNAGPKILGMPPSRWPKETRDYANVRLPRTMSAFQGDGWRRHLPQYVRHVDRHECLMTRSN